jgi:threonine/homoserine/homoserine lactone efflux protein
VAIDLPEIGELKMLELGGIFVTAFVVGLSGAMMPGPLLAVTIGESSRRGASAGPLLIVGHMILESALVAAVALGLASFLNNPRITIAIGLAGGAVMCWMGQDMLRSARTMSLTIEPGERRKMHPVWAGIVVSLSNPYWTIWWATIGLTYLMMGLKFGVIGILVFFVGHISSDFAWYSLVSFAAARGRNVLPDSVYRRVIAICGALVIAFGLWFLWTAAAAVMRG